MKGKHRRTGPCLLSLPAALWLAAVAMWRHRHELSAHIRGGTR
jgi:hypothetical protein